MLSTGDGGCFLGTKDPQAEGNVCAFSVSTVSAKTLRLDALFKNFRDQVCGVVQGFSIAEDVYLVLKKACTCMYVVVCL